MIADAYLAGVSNRRVEKLVQQLGIDRIGRSQVSRLAKVLDEIVEQFRTRPLDGARASRVWGSVPRTRTPASSTLPRPVCRAPPGNGV